MKLSDFDYNLPKNLVAQKPISPRDQSRLMVVDRQEQKIGHYHFYDMAKFLKKGDVLVLNNSKVLPARIFGKKETGAKVEILLVRPKGDNLKIYSWKNEWWVIGKPGLNLREIVNFSNGLRARVIKVDGYYRLLKFNCQGEKLKKIIYKIGEAPIPPYINNKVSADKLKKQYQTIYAKQLGSIAAPTAGFHFTPKLIKELKSKGIAFKFITLHVGPGTFQPIKSENIKDHKMMGEWVQIDKQTADFLNQAKRQKRRIITVGTTSVRSLEAFSDKKGIVHSGQKFVDLFIYPGYKFKVVDALITNFHLPKSTLLLLVSTLASKPLIFKAYKEAIKKKYRFFSFGDAMFII